MKTKTIWATCTSVCKAVLAAVITQQVGQAELCPQTIDQEWDRVTSETRGPHWGTEASAFPFHTGWCIENSECYGCVGTSRGTTEWTAREALPTPLILCRLWGGPLSKCKRSTDNNKGAFQPSPQWVRNRQDPTSGPRPCPKVGWTPQEGLLYRSPQHPLVASCRSSLSRPV